MATPSGLPAEQGPREDEASSGESDHDDDLPVGAIVRGKDGQVYTVGEGKTLRPSPTKTP